MMIAPSHQLDKLTARLHQLRIVFVEETTTNLDILAVVLTSV